MPETSVFFRVKICPHNELEYAVDNGVAFCKQEKISIIFSIVDNLQQQSNRWTIPVVGTFQMNVDAAIKEGHNIFSVGLILTDYQGQYITDNTRRFVGSVQVVEAETIVILEGLSWLEELPVDIVILEIDSVLNVDAINKSQQTI